MDGIKLTLEELDNLKQVSYFRGATITALKEIHKHIERIDKHLEISNGTTLALMKRQEEFGIRQASLSAFSKIYLLLFTLVIGAIIKIAFFNGGG